MKASARFATGGLLIVGVWLIVQQGCGHGAAIPDCAPADGPAVPDASLADGRPADGQPVDAGPLDGPDASAAYRCSLAEMPFPAPSHTVAVAWDRVFEEPPSPDPLGYDHTAVDAFRDEAGIAVFNGFYFYLRLDTEGNYLASKLYPEDPAGGERLPILIPGQVAQGNGGYGMVMRGAAGYWFCWFSTDLSIQEHCTQLTTIPGTVAWDPGAGVYRLIARSGPNLVQLSFDAAGQPLPEQPLWASEDGAELYIAGGKFFVAQPESFPNGCRGTKVLRFTSGLQQPPEVTLEPTPLDFEPGQPSRRYATGADRLATVSGRQCYEDPWGRQCAGSHIGNTVDVVTLSIIPAEGQPILSGAQVPLAAASSVDFIWDGSRFVYFSFGFDTRLDVLDADGNHVVKNALAPLAWQRPGATLLNYGAQIVALAPNDYLLLYWLSDGYGQEGHAARVSVIYD